jgi:hypothetical protein
MRNTDVSHMIADALFAYMELCNFAKITPDKEVYQILRNCKKGEKLDVMTSFIETEHGNLEKGFMGNLETLRGRFVEKFKPAVVELSQWVPLSEDNEEPKIKQIVNYDPLQNWMQLTHGGDTQSMSKENYDRLVHLAENTIHEVD